MSTTTGAGSEIGHATGLQRDANGNYREWRPWPEDRKFDISLFTTFLMFWTVLVMIGSFFRGEGQNFVFPWNAGLFFDL